MTDILRVVIAAKPWRKPWAIAIVEPSPLNFFEHGCLHICAGNPAIVRDCDSGEVVVTGRSLRDVCQRLADFLGLTVVLSDAVHDRTTGTFHPLQAATPATQPEADHV